ncbi:MAG: hypothetical protein JSU70_17410 [Phycisphaerales bacterium]|nr:MAG: hypothetical protein JSU70_17410 [Phycisphaerales bacterium]
MKSADPDYEREYFAKGVISRRGSELFDRRFVFGSGLRRFYSGGFFAMLGVVAVVNILRGQQDIEE